MYGWITPVMNREIVHMLWLLYMQRQKPYALWKRTLKASQVSRRGCPVLQWQTRFRESVANTFSHKFTLRCSHIKLHPRRWKQLVCTHLSGSASVIETKKQATPLLRREGRGTHPGMQLRGTSNSEQRSAEAQRRLQVYSPSLNTRQKPKP